MCGAALESSSRSFVLSSLPWAEIVLVLVITGVVALWWSRPPSDEGVSLASPATNTATFTPVVPTSSPMPSPTSTNTPTPAATPVPVVHTVSKGEFPLYIAGMYGVTVADLFSANGMSEESLIRPGDKLTIPRPTSSGGPAEIVTPPAARESGIYSYVVQKGDTVAGIAVRFQVSVETIQELNHLTASSVIQPQQALLVPVGDVTPTPVSAQVMAGVSTLTQAAQPRNLPAPHLLGPAPGARFDGDVPILLRWASVGVLMADEWYEGCIWPVGDGECAVTTARTKATSWRVPPEVRPKVGSDNHILQWTVRIVRSQGEVSGAAQDVEAISPTGEIRHIEWY